jgi:uncharacterized membrane protein (DUF2068 family)
MTWSSTGYARGVDASVGADLSSADAPADGRGRHGDGGVGESARRGVWALARAGLAARGVVYLLVGVVAAEIALDALLDRRAPRTSASTEGVVQALAAHPVGRVTLVALAVGLAGYVVFSLIDAVRSHNDEHPAAKRWGDRALSVFGAAIYAFFCEQVVAAIVRPTPAAGSAASAHAHDRAVTAEAMALPAGRELVGLVGVVLVISFFFLARRAIGRSFADRFERAEMGERWWRAAMVLGSVGYFLRGVAFGVVGVFIVVAAIRFEPGRGVGLDGSLRQLAHDPWGPAVLFPIAVGLVVYGVYLGIETRFRTI